MGIRITVVIIIRFELLLDYVSGLNGHLLKKKYEIRDEEREK